MKEETILKLGKAACGTAILITSMVTGVNGPFQLLGILLLGLPAELLTRGKGKENKE